MESDGMHFSEASRKVLPEHFVQDPHELSVLLSAIALQQSFCIDELANFLASFMHYDQAYAVTTARQIIPKVFFYSMLVRSRSGCYALLDDLKRLYTSPATEEITATRRRLFVELAPEITVYLFDQTIDSFNSDHRDTSVQHAVDTAALALPHKPNHYLDIMTSLHRQIIASPRYQVHEVPESHRAFALLVPYIKHLQAMGAQPEDIEMVLLTISDVNTLGHTAQLAFKAANEMTRFTSYEDFIMRCGKKPDVEHPDRMDPMCAMGFAIASNGGVTLVAANHYLLYNYGRRLLDPSHSFRSVAQLLQETPELKGTLRFLAGVIRVGDDLGDLLIDKELKAPNLFLFSDEAKRHFLAHCLFDTLNVKSYLVKFVIAGIMDRPDFRDDLLNAMLDIETKMYEMIRKRYPGQEDLSRFLEILAGIVWGGLLNSVLDDRQAEQIGIAVHADSKERLHN